MYADATKCHGITILRVICDGLFGVAYSCDGTLVMGCEWPSQKPKSHKDGVLIRSQEVKVTKAKQGPLQRTGKTERPVSQGARHHPRGFGASPCGAWGQNQ